jgi:hypothetical protein
MNEISEKDLEKANLKCPECRSPLKKRKTRKPDECELVCGGCGAIFDVCNLDTLDYLKKKQS